MLLYDIIESCGFSYDLYESNFIDIYQFTEAGEDWHESIYFDGTLEDFMNRINERLYNFDIDEEIEPWVNSAGKNGVPKITELVEDAKWKKRSLECLYAQLHKYYLING